MQRLKFISAVFTSSIGLVLLIGVVYAGTLSPSADPAATSYTLTDIYNRLTTNATAIEEDHDFSPSATPAGTLYTMSQVYNAIPTINPVRVLSGTTYLGVAGTLTPENGASATLTATNALCGTTYFGSGSDTWTPSTGTLCTGFCQACADGSCTNADANTDENSHCGGASCCGYCDGSGGCDYVVAGGTCSSPGTVCNEGNVCDGSGGCGLPPDETPPVPGNGGTINWSTANGVTYHLYWTAATDDTSSAENLSYYVCDDTETENGVDTIDECENSADQVMDWTLNTTFYDFIPAPGSHFLNVIVKDEAGNKALYTPF